jgi:hypothetical protein
MDGQRTDSTASPRAMFRADENTCTFKTWNRKRISVPPCLPTEFVSNPATRH